MPATASALRRCVCTRGASGHLWHTETVPESANPPIPAAYDIVWAAAAVALGGRAMREATP